MADLKKTIDIVFGATDKTGQVVKGIGKNLDSLSGQVGNISGPLASVGNSILALDAAVVALGVTLAGISIKEAAEFQTAFNEISTLIDADSQALDQFSGDIQNYAGNSTQSLSDINAAIYAAISAGADYTDSLAVVGDAEKLAVAGKAGLSDTLVSLISTINAYGDSTDQAGRYSDTFFKIVKFGQTTIPELSSSLSQVTGIASSAGVPFEELGAAIAALTANGQPTSQAITGIKAALSNIIKPTKDARETAAELGLEFNSTALATKGLGGFIDDIKNKTGGSVDAMSSLFGSVEGLNSVLILTGNGNEKFLATLKDMQSGSESLTAAFNKMANNLGLVSQTMQNNLQLAFIGFGKEILPQFTDDLQAISAVFSSLTFSINKTETFKPIYNALNEFGFDFEQTALAIAKSLPEALSLVDFSGAIDAWKGVGSQLGGLFDGIDVSTPEGLAKAIQAAVDSVSSLGSVTEGIASSFVPFVKSIFSAIDAFNGLTEEAKINAGATVGLGQVVNQILPVIEGMSTAVTTLGYGLSALVLLDTAKGLGSLVPSFSSAATAAGVFAKSLGLVGAAATGWQIGTSIYENFGDEVRAATEPVFDFADALFDFTGRGESFDRQVDQLANNFADLGIAIDRSGISVENIQYYWESYYAALKQADGGVLDTADSMQTLDDAVSDAADSQKDLTILSGELGVAYDGMSLTIDDLTKKTEDYTDSGKALVANQSDVGKSMAESADKAVKLNKDLSKLAIEVYKTTVEVQIEEAANQVKKFEASLDSLGDSIKGSQSLISDLFGVLAGGDLEWWQADQLMNIIREEARLKAEQMELQNDLIKAELENIRLKNRALANGDSQITITGDGLEPELEAFMFKILERVQLRASQEQAAFLIPGG